MTILSYNYDTILEKTLRWAGIGFIYGSSRINNMFGPGLSYVPPELYVDELDTDQRVVHLAKPHGSCNFTGWAIRSSEDINGPIPHYPLSSPYILRDTTLKVLTDKNIFEPSHLASLVLPGELSCWHGNESTYVPWASEQKQYFINDSYYSDKLLIIGFGYGIPDRAEFNSIILNIKTFEQIHIVDPNPSSELIEFLKKTSNAHLYLWPNAEEFINRV